jgi:DNA invertase Pin-like site-specific DNA recombinase
MIKAIIYTRVSTNKQGVSGLGLESQLDIANQYCEQNELLIIETYTEIQSGGKNDREMIKEALRRCELTGALLVVAKLDRISRDIGFIDQLQKSNIRFVCADMPEANESMINFMSVFAQYERKMASVRTKAALAAKKKQGAKLGTNNLTKDGASKGRDIASKVIKEKANERASLVCTDISRAIAEGFTSLRQIATYLNDNHIMTPRGKKWTASSVKNTKDRCMDLGTISY